MTEPKQGSSSLIFQDRHKIASTSNENGPVLNVPPANSTNPQSPPEAQQVEHPIQPVDTSGRTPPENRMDLITRARSFLASPQVRHQDLAAKRTFLVEKGLNDLEIEKLLKDIPPPMPTIPPKTYPQPRPSNLPVLLLGLVRLFSWLAGGSAVLLFIYHRILLPRITRTSLARHSLKSHHLSLFRQLTTSLSSLKESQSESLSVLPRPDPSNEPKLFAACTSVQDILKLVEETDGIDFSQIPHTTLLRCGIMYLSKDKEGRPVHPTTNELYRYLEVQIPWLLTEEGFEYENKMWETLSTSPLFGKVAPSAAPVTQLATTSTESLSGAQTHWEYIAPAAVDDPALFKSLLKLSCELPRDTKTRKSPFQHTLQSLSDFTGYISTQVYLPYRSPASLGITAAGGQSSLEEDLRKEIRALKGLVLNRRSFMPPVIPRASIPSASMRPSP